MHAIVCAPYLVLFAVRGLALREGGKQRLVPRVVPLNCIGTALALALLNVAPKDLQTGREIRQGTGTMCTQTFMS
jgi:hypothetical protein